jgi:hypothetical protein
MIGIYLLLLAILSPLILHLHKHPYVLLQCLDGYRLSINVALGALLHTQDIPTQKDHLSHEADGFFAVQAWDFPGGLDNSISATVPVKLRNGGPSRDQWFFGGQVNRVPRNTGSSARLDG